MLGNVQKMETRRISVILILHGIICKTQTNSAFSLESQQFRKRQEKWQTGWQADDD